MTQFSTTNQPAKNGRPIGSKNKRTQFSDNITAEAIRQLEKAVCNGDSWAIECVLKRTNPILKSILPEDSLEGEMLKLKIKEITDFEERLKALELITFGNQN